VLREAWRECKNIGHGRTPSQDIRTVSR